MLRRLFPEKLANAEIAMQALGALIALMVFCGSFPAQGGTLYIISLKNGGEFKTSYYWEEGYEIRFYIHGGVMGIAKNTVGKIQMRKGSMTTRAENTEVDRIAELTISHDNVDETQESKNLSINIKYYQEKRMDLREKLEDAIMRHKEATERKDLEAKDVAWKEMVDVNGALTELVEEVKEKYNGVLPEWWSQQIGGRPQ